MFTPKSIYTELAWNVVYNQITTGSVKEIRKNVFTKELQVKASCFVSLHEKNGDLRGCIGTIEPVYNNLALEIIENAIAAATRDPRFEPVSIHELSKLVLSVDVLSLPVKVKDISELNPRTKGVIVSDGRYNRGVLLPDLAGVDTIEQQLNIAKRKAGLSKAGFDGLDIYSFTSTRYE